MKYYIWKNISTLLLAFSLLCMASVMAYAHEVPDISRKGTVTVAMQYEGKAVNGGILTAYRVGRIQEKDGNVSFIKTEAIEAFTGSYDSIDSAKLAEDVDAFVEKNHLPAYATAENKNGKAVFSKLELGLYLIVQTKASEGYAPLTSFLVSVPMNEDGHYVYEVNAEGKFQLTQKPESTVTPKPPEPSLPQTGQFNWPVPVLTVAGLLLFAFGWVLRFTARKEQRYET